MYSKSSIWDDIKREYQKGDAVTRLIFINVAVFLFINLAGLILGFFMGRPEWVAWLTRQFTLPADLSKLISRPWTLVTHMFAHAGFFHILFNMLWLYWMGRILREYLGNRKIIPIYVLGALAGAMLYILAYNTLPALRPSLPFSEALGASAGVMAIVVATATLLPDYRIHLLLIGPVKLKWLALAAVALDVLAINGSNAGGSIAHLGGALFGYIFIKQLQNGHDWSRGINHLLDTLATLGGPTKGPHLHYKNERKSAEYRKRKDRTAAKKKNKYEGEDYQKKLDEILDKISRSGYDGLSKAEKDFLFKMSKK